MAAYRAEKLGKREPLTDLPTFPGVRLIEGIELPDRHEVYAELSERHSLNDSKRQPL